MWKLLKNKRQFTPSGSLSSLSWKRFKRNKLSYISLIFILITIVISILGYLITPDSTPFSNQQYLELTAKKPGFAVKMLLVKKEKDDSNNHNSLTNAILKKMIYGERSRYQHIPINSCYFEGEDIVIEPYDEDIENRKSEVRGQRSEILRYWLPDVVYGVKKSTQTISQYSTQIEELRNVIKKRNITSVRFLLGTDRFGRDMLSQLIIGTRVSLSVGLISVLISLLVGVLLGSLAGFFRGRTDDIIVWFINVVWSIPSLLLVIAITFALGKGFWQVFIAVGLTMWVEVARVVRGQIISIREKEFVEAARALGFRNSRIIFRHILPNVMGSVIVISAANFASAILIEAGLSFLGLGVQPPVPSWGTMIREHYSYIILGNAYLPLIPGIAIMIMVLAFMLIGNGLRDALDVKLVQTS
jgi:peptide/nickel transport system permease protein